MKSPPATSALPLLAKVALPDAQPLCVCACKVEAPVLLCTYIQTPFGNGIWTNSRLALLFSACSHCKVHEALLSHLHIPTVRIVIQVRLPVAGVPNDVALSAAALLQSGYRPDLVPLLSELPL